MFPLRLSCKFFLSHMHETCCTNQLIPHGTRLDILFNVPIILTEFHTFAYIKIQKWLHAFFSGCITESCMSSKEDSCCEQKELGWERVYSVLGCMRLFAMFLAI